MSTASAVVRPLLVLDGVHAWSTADLALLSTAGLGHPEPVDSLPQAAARLAEHPESVLLVPLQHGSAELETFGDTLRAHPGAIAIAIAPTRDADLVLTALRAGVREFLVAPLRVSELVAAVARMIARPSVIRSMPLRSAGQVIAVHAAKGGLGTSTVAASLAYALTERRGGSDASQPRAPRVALVDFTTSGAGLRVMLNVEPANDLAHLLQRASGIDLPFVRSLVHEHDGVALLAAGTADALESLDATTATQLITLLRQEFDYVVIDTDQFLTEQTLAALDAADQRLLITTPEIMAVRSAQQAVALCRRLGYPDHTLRVVLNRVTDRDPLAAHELERVLGIQISAQLPNAYRECHAAIAAGTFAPRHARQSPLHAGFVTLAATVAGDDVPSRVLQRPTGLVRFFRRSVHA